MGKERQIATDIIQSEKIIKEGYAEHADMHNVVVEKDGRKAVIASLPGFDEVESIEVKIDGRAYEAKHTPAFSLQACIDIIGYDAFRNLICIDADDIKTDKDLFAAVTERIVNPKEYDIVLTEKALEDIKSARKENRNGDVVFSFGDDENCALFNLQKRTLDFDYMGSHLHMENVKDMLTILDAMRLMLKTKNKTYKHEPDE